MKDENKDFIDKSYDEPDDDWFDVEDDWSGLDDEPDDELTSRIIEYLDSKSKNEGETEKNSNQETTYDVHDEESIKKDMYEAYEDEFEQELQNLSETANEEDSDEEDSEYEDGEFEYELDELEDEYEYRRDTFGESDLRTVRAKYNLALAYWRRDDEWDTYYLLLDVLLTWKYVKDKKDPDMLKLKHTLGMAALYCEYPDEAYERLTETYELRLEVLGEKHPDTIETLVGLIKVCSWLGNESECKKYIEKYEELTGKKFEKELP